MINPYQHLARKVRDLLMAEAKLSVEERKANQWQLLFKFADTQITIGKGDVNTIFFQFGENGSRKVCYPDDILDRLDRMGKQRYWRYVVRDKNNEAVKYYWLESLALKSEPGIKYKINGINGAGETTVMIGTGDIEGRRWTKASGKKTSNA